VQRCHDASLVVNRKPVILPCCQVGIHEGRHTCRVHDVTKLLKGAFCSPHRSQDHCNTHILPLCKPFLFACCYQTFWVIPIFLCLPFVQRCHDASLVVNRKPVILPCCQVGIHEGRHTYRVHDVIKLLKAAFCSTHRSKDHCNTHVNFSGEVRKLLCNGGNTMPFV
jgi:hypothetical protein